MLLALDAGHWIGEPGRRCSKEFDPQQHREWWLNNRVACFLSERAKQYENFKIIRTDDVTGAKEVLLKERCRIANDAKADFFLSIHHNGGINGGTGGGLVAYSYPNSEKGAEWRDALYSSVLDAGKLRGNRANPKTTANFAVLRDTNMPAVLIEHGFMDSSTDVPIILTDSYAKACGYAEADCIAKRFNLKLKPVEDAKPDNQAKEPKRYYYLKEITEPFYRPSIDRLIENGIFSGKGGSGDDRVIDLSEDCIRILVILELSGVFYK